MTDGFIVIGLFALLLILIFLRLEIAFAIGLISIVWLAISGQSGTIGVTRIFSGLDRFVLLAIPFFLLAGELMNKSGVTSRLVDAANFTVGRFRGGLAQSNVGASLLFSGLSGAAVADVAALGRIFIPSMADNGYDRDFSAAVTAASSLVGPIIPPSIIIVVYGAVTGVSIGALFTAALIPGVLLGLGLMTTVAIIAKTSDLPKHEPDVDTSELPSLLFHTIVALSVPAVILIGITQGYMTPTEAAAIASAYAFILGTVVYRSLNLSKIKSAFYVTVERTTQLYAIIGFSGLMIWILGREGVTRDLAAYVADLGLGPILFLLLIAVILLFVGTWLEIGAATILLGPILADLAADVGIPDLQFGIIFILTLNFGLITPPVGICLFAASSVGEVPVWDISKKILPFFVTNAAVLLLIMFIPEMTLALPERWGYI
ncbi:TRAP transporter large permease [Natronorubrum sp. A-ect3]|uniref:TRAP transporter large permease n=1 Tax=Natronorubrum sp. A-ect3 TaxID=3242698 RepID=UPI00359DA47B